MSHKYESGLEVSEDANHLPETYRELEQDKPDAKEAYSANTGQEDRRAAPWFQQGRQTSEQQRIFGLKPAVCVALVALFTALIVGGAIGGGLGAALANEQNRAARTVTLTSTITQTTYSAPPAASTTTNGQLVDYAVAAPGSVYSVALDCPNLDGKSYTSVTNSQLWTLSCSTGQDGGDIGATVAYTYIDYMESCAKMNHYQGSNVCTRIQFSSGIAANYEYPDYGNCWLKNDSATAKIIGNTDLGAILSNL